MKGRAIVLGVFFVLSFAGTVAPAHAQQPEPLPPPSAPAPPPTYSPQNNPPPGYVPPQYGAQPPPQYGQPQYAPPGYGYGQPQYPPPAYQPTVPRKGRWRDGDPIPVGYHVEEVPRYGLATAGWIVLLIPYVIGLFGAAIAQFENQSGWLAAPVLGPAMYLGQRKWTGGCKHNSSDGLGCAGDVLVATGIGIDLAMQVAGATMILFGYLTTRPELVRDEPRAAGRLRLRPMPMTIGTGYGLGLGTAF